MGWEAAEAADGLGVRVAVYPVAIDLGKEKGGNDVIKGANTRARMGSMPNCG